MFFFFVFLQVALLASSTHREAALPSRAGKGDWQTFSLAQEELFQPKISRC